MILQQPFAISPSPTGFNYYSPFTIQTGQVPSTQTDFPILISVTDTRFKTVANGGHVLDAEGDDIRPYSDSSITTAITGYEKVFYDGANGILEMWVKRSSVSDGLVTYLAYGNPSLTTDASSTATWSSSFISVYHLKDGTSLSLTDSVGAHNGTNHGGTAATGQIDGGVAYVAGSSQYSTMWASLSPPTALTFSLWAKVTAFPGSGNVVAVCWNTTAGPQTVNSLGVTNTSKAIAAATNAGIITVTGTTTLSTATWYYLSSTYSSGTFKIWVNGVSDGTTSSSGNLSSTATELDVSRNPRTVNEFWDGSLDEIRIASVARTADWLATEYNNQSAPSTFQTLGTEVPL